MNRRYYFGIASVLVLVCLVCIFGLFANALNIISIGNLVENISAVLLIICGYAAVFFCGLGLNDSIKAQKIVRISLWTLFFLYAVMLVDFTLISDAYGRNILNIFNWNFNDWSKHLTESTNFIPFATVRLFINGYKNHNLSLTDTLINLLGNLLIFMPFTFFVSIFKKRKIRWISMLFVLLAAIALIEVLQLIFMIGACDIDDLILNLGGAMMFYLFICKPKVSRIISWLTFGVWKINDKEN